MPPSLTKPSQELLLKVLTASVSAMGSLIITILILAWNGIDDRLSRIEDSFHMVEGSVIALQTEYHSLENRVSRHDYIIENGK